MITVFSYYANDPFEDIIDDLRKIIKRNPDLNAAEDVFQRLIDILWKRGEPNGDYREVRIPWVKILVQGTSLVYEYLQKPYLLIQELSDDKFLSEAYFLSFKKEK